MTPLRRLFAVFFLALGLFANAAQAVERTGNQVRIVQAVWAQRSSEPTDVSLRSLAERGLRLEIGRSE